MVLCPFYIFIMHVERLDGGRSVVDEQGECIMAQMTQRPRITKQMVAAKMKELHIVGFRDHGMAQQCGGLRRIMHDLLLIEACNTVAPR